MTQNIVTSLQPCVSSISSTGLDAIWMYPLSPILRVKRSDFLNLSFFLSLPCTLLCRIFLLCHKELKNSYIRLSHNQRNGASLCRWTGEGGALQRLCSPVPHNSTPMRGEGGGGEPDMGEHFCSNDFSYFFQLFYKHLTCIYIKWMYMVLLIGCKCQKSLRKLIPLLEFLVVD